MKKYLITFALLALLPTTGFVADPEALTGVKLYQQYCANCHGKFEKTRIPDRTARRISSSIRTMGIMANLNNLSQQQIEAIANVLESTPELPAGS